MSRRAVVIGGGLGGLATALRLRASGWQVNLFEASSSFGGKMNNREIGGYHFDTGPSLITMPWVFANLFQAAGRSIEDYLEIVALDRLSEYVYADGVHLHYSASLPEWLGELERVAPGDKDAFFRFMELGARLWGVSRKTFLQRAPFEPPAAGLWSALRKMPISHAWGNYSRTVEAHFTSPHLRQLFNRYPTYVGSSPYRAPATLAVIAYLEYAFGGWYVKGGLYRIVEALVSIARGNGAELLLDSEVNSIEKQNGRVTGVVLASGKHCAADVIVMNGDAATTATLLGEAETEQRSRSLSGFVMLLGVDRELPQVGQHTIFFSADYKREFDQLFREQEFPDDPTVYVNVPSRADRSVVPGKGETLFVMANAPSAGRQWKEQDIRDARDRVMRRLQASGFPDLRGHIAVEDIWTPSRMEECYLAPGGAIYGSDSHGWRNAFLRPRNKSPRYGGLYHVGGSTHPGGGTPTVLLSAEITSRLIAKHELG